MGKWISIFNTTSEFEEFKVTSGYSEPHVTFIKDGSGVQIIQNYKERYLTFKIISEGDIKWNGSTAENSLQYSKDNGETWTTVNSGDTIPVSYEEKIMWKGTGTPQVDAGIGTFSGDTNAKYKIEGNAMSLLFGDDFIGQKSLSGKDYAFYGLFSGNTNVVRIENMVLPATTLAEHCYQHMFRECTSLTTAPSLPATTLAEHCYQDMFNGCSSLAVVPELSAITLVDYCYTGMFFGCTSLTRIPKNYLPATTMTIQCYNSMFRECTSLTSIPSDLLPATTLAKNCYVYMFQKCTSLTSVPSDLLPATTLAEYCYQGMFNGCSSLTSVPSNLLPATTLAEHCYQHMFRECTSLTTAPSLPATTLAEHCYKHMFRECTSLTTAPSLPATTLAEHCYQYMFYGCTLLNNITCLATDISATGCTQYWTLNVSASGTFTKASSMSSWTTGVNGIPNDWTVQDAT